MGSFNYNRYILGFLIGMLFEYTYRVRVEPIALFLAGFIIGLILVDLFWYKFK